MPAGDQPDPASDAEAPNGILKDSQQLFYVAAIPVGLISGIYVGDVEVVRLDTKLIGGSPQEVEGKVLDTVGVEVPL